MTWSDNVQFFVALGILAGTILVFMAYDYAQDQESEESDQDYWGSR